jgi:hypothetical protein
MAYKKPFDSRVKRRVGPVALAVFAAFMAPALAATETAAQSPAGGRALLVPSASKDAAAPSAAGKTSPYYTQKQTHNAKTRLAAAWGVDKLKVSYTASGNLIRFNYRVTDPVQAKVLGDKSATPYLVGQKNNVALQIPVMDKVGQLRQTGKLLAGQEYWMVFSNKGNLIKRGDRVNVMIGSFHADGLMVE